MDKDKKEFIWKRGVLRVGLPVALMMSTIAGYQAPGHFFNIQAFNVRTFLTSLALFMPVFLVAGYFWGIFVYRFTRKK